MSEEIKTVTPRLVRKLIDFNTQGGLQTGLAEQQLAGTVAVYNMLARNRIAYLADEVGMGKTYIALGVMSLLRCFNPRARIVVIAPRENIQRKWEKELRNFIRLNWLHEGTRMKGLQGGPAWEPVVCDSIMDFVREALLDSDRDFFLRMTSFSLRLKEEESRAKLRRQLRRLLPWVKDSALRARTPEGFRDAFGCALNAAVPLTDLLVIDEGHNLKHGFGPKVSIRNRVLGMAFGHPEGENKERCWYRPKARRVLMLSATPFEEDYGAIRNQFAVFGYGDLALFSADGESKVSMSDLGGRDAKDENKRQVVDRLMVRRVSALNVAGEDRTKNMYRREWRGGGLRIHDEPMAVEDPMHRLVVALVQKKVAEVLQDERFNNHFQIGMLSSFESFFQSLRTAAKRRKLPGGDDEEEGDVFDGEEQKRRARAEERKGIDTEAVANIAESFRERFRRGLPHPKLDLMAESLRNVFEAKEKVLVFVRRVATVDELAVRLNSDFDGWLKRTMKDALPGMEKDVDRLFRLYDQASRRSRAKGMDSEASTEPDDEITLEDQRYIDEIDEGSTETFFSWFFRGKGPRGILSGAAFQKNRLSNVSAAETNMFEDDYGAWLLGRPANVIEGLSARTGSTREDLERNLREKAFSHLQHLSKQKDGYPRYFVFQAYQIAALEIMEGVGGELGEKARVVLEERFHDRGGALQEVPTGFPGPEEALGVQTFFTELVERTDLREKIWPDERGGSFRYRFRRREQRRELISSLSRLGLSYVDLYLIAISQVGSFDLHKRGGSSDEKVDLAVRYVDFLERQMKKGNGLAFCELSRAAETFDLLLAVNFPEVPDMPLQEVARKYGETLQRQVPVGRMSGKQKINKRLIRQFRMPGFPFVLVTTDVLQEGEDLHTFCHKVVHYGIAWTPSAMEQRTGRVDRVGSLFQRSFDGTGKVPTDDDQIQVFLPHLRDTVEVLQVRRVLKRMNRFFSLMHKAKRDEEHNDSRIDVAREIFEDIDVIPPIKGLLESAFPIKKEWLVGELDADDMEIPRFDTHERHLNKLWKELIEELEILDRSRMGYPRKKEGILTVIDEVDPEQNEGSSESAVDQEFRLELRSQVAGDSVLLKCVSDVGKYDINDERIFEALYELHVHLGNVKVCTWPIERERKENISIEGEILFDPNTTQKKELVALVCRTVEAASTIKSELCKLMEWV